MRGQNLNLPRDRGAVFGVSIEGQWGITVEFGDNGAMTTQLSTVELAATQALLQDYGPAQSALATLHQHQGNLASSLEDLAAAAAGTATYGEDRKTLRQVLLANLPRSRETDCSPAGG